ncbi:MAG: MFS transporter [Thermoflexibacter sp.]|nr:MFS transporter [Thermoflexibacter sp.]
MLQTVIALYKNAYGGLPRSSWLLASIMLINRSGSMVIPFMGVYLTQKLRFSLTEAGIIITIFGLGSMIGAYMGGWFSDKIGSYKVQFWSLVLGGAGFFGLMMLYTFWQLAISIFVISIIVESLRPANSASVAEYSTPENLTRSYSLNRLAANLGYAIGPTLGGLLAGYDFRYLFLADGFTCIVAGLFFSYWFKPSLKNPPKKVINTETKDVKSPLQDYLFLSAIGLTAICVVTFFQMFTVMPLYFKQECLFSEQKIGILLALNGLMVALFEMLIVYKIAERVSQLRMISYGVIMLILAFVMIMLSKNLFIIVLSIAFFTFGEIFMFPYMNVFTINRSTPASRGKFIGMYASVFSIAWTFAPLIGTNIAEKYNFMTLWYMMIGFNVLGLVGFQILEQKIKKRHN